MTAPTADNSPAPDDNHGDPSGRRHDLRCASFDEILKHHRSLTCGFASDVMPNFHPLEVLCIPLPRSEAEVQELQQQAHEIESAVLKTLGFKVNDKGLVESLEEGGIGDIETYMRSLDAAHCISGACKRLDDPSNRNLLLRSLQTGASHDDKQEDMPPAAKIKNTVTKPPSMCYPDASQGPGEKDLSKAVEIALSTNPSTSADEVLHLARATARVFLRSPNDTLRGIYVSEDGLEERWKLASRLKESLRSCGSWKSRCKNLFQLAIGGAVLGGAGTALVHEWFSTVQAIVLVVAVRELLVALCAGIASSAGGYAVYRGVRDIAHRRALNRKLLLLTLDNFANPRKLEEAQVLVARKRPH